MPRVIAAACLLLTLAACASNTDLDVLRRDVDNLKRDTFESKKEVDAIRDRTTKVVREDSFNALRDSQGDLNARVSEITSGLQELRGRFEESKYYQDKLLKDSASEKDLLRAQIAGIETQVRNLKDRLALLEESEKKRTDTGKGDAENTSSPEQQNAMGSRQESGEGMSAEKEKPAVAEDKAAVYDSAYKLFKDRKFRESREKFETFLKEAPKDKLAANAQFWIAETYYAEKDYESAILAYETLLKKHPDSDKTPGALLKQGYAFADIGDSKTARVILEKLVQKHPGSKEAAMAKKRLAELEKKPGRKK